VVDGKDGKNGQSIVTSFVIKGLPQNQQDQVGEVYKIQFLQVGVMVSLLN